MLNLRNLAKTVRNEIIGKETKTERETVASPLTLRKEKNVSEKGKKRGKISSDMTSEILLVKSERNEKINLGVTFHLEFDHPPSPLRLGAPPLALAARRPVSAALPHRGERRRREGSRLSLPSAAARGQTRDGVDRLLREFDAHRLRFVLAFHRSASAGPFPHTAPPPLAHFLRAPDGGGERPHLAANEMSRVDVVQPNVPGNGDDQYPVREVHAPNPPREKNAQDLKGQLRNDDRLERNRLSDAEFEIEARAGFRRRLRHAARPPPRPRPSPVPLSLLRNGLLPPASRLHAHPPPRPAGAATPLATVATRAIPAERPRRCSRPATTSWSALALKIKTESSMTTNGRDVGSDDVANERPQHLSPKSVCDPSPSLIWSGLHSAN